MSTATYNVNLPAVPVSAGIGYMIGVQVGYEAPINRTPAVGGTINTPLVARGQAAVNYLARSNPTGTTGINFALPMTALAAPTTTGATGTYLFDTTLVIPPGGATGAVSVDRDWALTGGQIGTQEFGDGSRSLTYTAIYTFFAEAD